MTFTGFAKRRNRIQSAPPQTREQRQIQAGTDQFLSDFDQRQQLEKASATQALDSLRVKFQADQDMRQSLYELQSEQARFRREQERSIYESEIAKLDAASAEKNELFESISGISQTASDYLVKQAEERAENRIQFGQGLAQKYGLTPDEVADLSELERGLDQYRLSDIPIIQRLRDMGASETELEQLIGLSGWAKEGAVRSAVQNAAGDYAGYLRQNSETKVLINGSEVSLAEAEQQQSLELQGAVLDKLRGNFLNEYLPNVKPEYIQNYSKQQFSIADSQRKTALSQEIEKSAGVANAMNERNSFITNVLSNADLQDPLSIAMSMQSELGKIEAYDNPAILNNHIGHIAKSVENRSIDIQTAQKFLSLNGFGVRYSELVDPIRQAITVRSNEVRQANSDEQLRQRRQSDQVMGRATLRFQDMKEAGVPITEDDINVVVRELEGLEIGPYIIGQSKARLAPYLEFDNEYHNDEEFKKENEAFFRGLPSDITLSDLARAGLSPELYRQAAQLIQSPEYPQVAKGTLSRKRRDYKNRLSEILFQGTKRPGEISSTLEPATDAVLDIWQNTYNTVYKQNGDANEAERAANSKVDEILLQANSNVGLLARKQSSVTSDGTLIFDREFGNFVTKPGQAPVITPDRNNLVDKVRRDPTVINTEQLIPTDALKVYAFDAQTNPNPTMPVELLTIFKASGIDPAKILQAQLDIARRTDPNIPEIPTEVLQKPRRSTERATEYSLENLADFIRYVPSDTELLLDRQSNYRNSQVLFSNESARVNPQRSAISYFRDLGFSNDDIVTWVAIMYGESGTSGWDSARRENSEERSYGRFQINTKVHSEFLASLGMRPEHMFDPMSNMKAAVMLYRRRIEAGDDGFADWGAYTNGSYLDHIDKARQDLIDFDNAPIGYQNRDNYRDDISDENLQSLGVLPYQSPLQLGSNAGIIITAERDSDQNQPGSDFVIEGGKNGAKFFWPYRSEVKKVGTGHSGYGNYVDILTTLPSGNTTQVRIAHFDSVNTQLTEGMLLPANTFLGTQGMTGSTNGAPHISADFYHESEFYTHNEEARIEFLNAYLKPRNYK